MKQQVEKILLESADPVSEIVKIIESKESEIKKWKTILVFFIIVFVGWYCIHVSVNHGQYKQNCCAKKDTTIAELRVVVGLQKTGLDSAVYIKDIK